ncbi:AraC family transcriptional regulator [Arenibacter sp. ARW7G5Y1]|uniref:AraC family transcriptional regulator n=1 Tax=Arenibacter sp. ARW7G5Y1 TaxID=2135619 RepID=UPI000D772D40|nr:AraC family transcriptional regulator [Arenibacter sp. ARW7G5Y1]PXX30516.1 AraC family transcriptional regulator [Arenibacter sp. ARW7G5Y1]
MDIFFQHVNPINASIYMRHAKQNHFVVPWHFHPEIEIMYVINGEGTRIVGDSIQQFNAGDFVLVGSHTPHLWRNHNEYYENKGLYSECLLLFFKEETFGTEFLSIEEMSDIKRMLTEAKRGLRFSGHRSEKLKNLMLQAYNEKGIDRILTSIRLLNEMAQFETSEVLCSKGYIPDVSYRDYDRLDNCLEFIMSNYKKSITLKEVADIANMTPNSFCRYFKRRTNMTFSKFLIEFRVGKACQLLLNTEKKIIEIAFDCGFNSLSNFNNQFASVKGMSPREYRKKKA